MRKSNSLHVYGQRVAVSLGEMFDLTIELLNGSSVDFIVHWESNASVILSHLALFAVESATMASHEYSVGRKLLHQCDCL